MNNKPLIVIGGGGHASVLVDILKVQKREIKAIISPDDISSRLVFNGIPHLLADEEILCFPCEQVEVVNAIGTMPGSTLRRQITEKYLQWGYQFATVISDSAYVSTDAIIGNGVQILSRTVINPGAVIGNHTIINTGAIVEHDCILGAFNFIAPGTTLCGHIKTGDNVFIGAGATIIPGLKIDDNARVAAGATLITSLKSGQTCYSGKMIIK